MTPEKAYLLTMPMKRLEDKLPPESFQHIHRSHIVNLRRVDEVADGMVRIDKEMLPLSPATPGGVYEKVECGVRVLSRS